MASILFAGISADFETHILEIAFHDGNFNVDFKQAKFASVRDSAIEALLKPPNQLIMEKLDLYNNHEISSKILAAGIDSNYPEKFELARLLWTKLDIIPFIFTLKGHSSGERADSASRKCSMWFGPQTVPRISIGYRHLVEVDANHHIRIARLEDYRQISSSKTWNALLWLRDRILKRKISASFFNATAQGGGVALMRHAMIRLFHLLDLPISWHVPKPNPHVFRITKNNHNILQGVAPDNVRLTNDDIRCYEDWVKSNCERFWANGPFEWSDVIILDDPQVAGYVPYIKKVNKNASIIYRSHIEIRSDLIEKQDQQKELWVYLNKFISQCDLFISHPISSFIPKDVKPQVLLLPASTDRLDGLNKPLSDRHCAFWIDMFNVCSQNQCGNQLMYPDRPYIIQVARFDPSKGIDDVLQSYLLFREKASSNFSVDKIPQLVICGHGSIDDPDGTQIFNNLIAALKKPSFKEIKRDICVVRVPPEDRILNALMRCSSVALQLSHREGFEVKLTEAMLMWKPVIVYRTGGLPLQLPPHYPFIVEKVGATQQVAEYLYTLFSCNDTYKNTSKLVREFALREEYFNVYQCVNWLWLIYRTFVLSKDSAGEELEYMKQFLDTKNAHMVKDEWNKFPKFQ